VVESIREVPRVDVLCAGTDGVESREDILVAGAIAEHLLAHDRFAWKLDAAALAALAEWLACGGQLATELRETPGGRNLVEIGMGLDIVDCARIDALAVVPELDVSTWRITAV
jgi:phosphosulfolactate phosphohydrolase-like enzyme